MTPQPRMVSAPTFAAWWIRLAELAAEQPGT